MKIQSQRRYPEDQDGSCVYFVSEDVSRYIKVGHTTNLRRRMQHYNYTVPGETRIEGAIYVPTKTDACCIERVLLKWFRERGLTVDSNRRRSEWFRLSDGDIREAVFRALSVFEGTVLRVTGVAAPRVERVASFSQHRPNDAHSKIRWL